MTHQSALRLPGGVSADLILDLHRQALIAVSTVTEDLLATLLKADHGETTDPHVPV